METDIRRFRGVILGGFNRRDVADYIELLAAERNRLQKKLEEAEARLQHVQGENQGILDFAANQQKEAQALRHTLEAEYAAKQEALLAQLAEKEETLRKETQALRETYRREANAAALGELQQIRPLLEALRADTAADADSFRSRMEELCSGLETSASAASEVCRRLDEMTARLGGEPAQNEAEVTDAVEELLQG